MYFCDLTDTAHLRRQPNNFSVLLEAWRRGLVLKYEIVESINYDSVMFGGGKRELAFP